MSKKVFFFVCILSFSRVSAQEPIVAIPDTIASGPATVDHPSEVVEAPTLSPRPADEAPLISQLLQIGYLSYDQALKEMADYALVQARQKELRQAYEAELKRVEDEFNQKYEAFLEGQRDFPRTILLKRQTELQQLLQQNLEFKRKGLKELEQAAEEAMAPLHKKLAEAIAKVAKRNGLALVVNTDSRACPFIDPDMGVDLQKEVKNLVK